MRIEINPYRKTKVYAPPVKEQELGYAGRKMVHEQLQTLIPQVGFIKCPHCLNGIAKQSVDCKDLVWDCVMCGWSKPVREPEKKRYGGEKIESCKRY